MNSSQIVDTLVDVAPFIMYAAVMIKIYKGWKSVKGRVDAQHRGQLAALLSMLAVVVAIFLAANAYALIFYGKTYLSLHVFQMFIIGNCAVYWLVIEYLTGDAAPTQGSDRESADRAG